MKTIKLREEGKSRVSRKLISRFGEALYIDPGVESVSLKVNFKDGTSISFERNEEEDDFERILKRRRKENDEDEGDEEEE